MTHVQRGNPAGAAELLRRAAERIDGYADAPPHGIDAAGLVAWARDVHARITDGDLAELAPADLTPALRG